MLLHSITFTAAEEHMQVSTGRKYFFISSSTVAVTRRSLTKHYGLDWNMNSFLPLLAQGGSRISAMAKNNSKEPPVAFYRNLFQCIGVLVEHSRASLQADLCH
jgi:hypothetical protein